MAEGFITRRGGVGAAERTASPSINFVSKTQTQIVVTFTNTEANEVDIFYGITSTLTDKVTVAASGTSSNVTFSGLDQNTPYTISAYAIVTDTTLKKIKSEIISTSITTDQIIYTAATGGTTLEYNDGGKRYKSHTFTSSGTFEVTTVGDAADDRNKVDYLIIAGGGGGGGAYGGGAGAGGYRTTVGTSGGNSSAESKVVVTAQAYSIDVGGGGNGSTGVYASAPAGSNGTDSAVFGIVSVGGGGGGTHAQNNPGNSGGSGGSGALNSGRGATIGTGTTGQGFDSGIGQVFTAFIGENSGGGGGAGAGGSNGVGGTAGAGGAGGGGVANLLRTGSNETRAGGGGGAGYNSGGAGGSGGGGAGGTTGGGGAGSVNTGGGGGGGPARSVDSAGGNGGSGIVIIRYEIAPSA